MFLFILQSLSHYFSKFGLEKRQLKYFFGIQICVKKNTIFVCFNWITTQIFPIFRFQLAIERKEDIQFHLVIRINEK